MVAMSVVVTLTIRVEVELSHPSVSGSFRGREFVRGPRDNTYRGYLVQENPWLQLQGGECLSTTKPIPDRTTPKPNNDAQTTINNPRDRS